MCHLPTVMVFMLRLNISNTALSPVGTPPEILWRYQYYHNVICHLPVGGRKNMNAHNLFATSCDQVIKMRRIHCFVTIDSSVHCFTAGHQFNWWNAYKMWDYHAHISKKKSKVSKLASQLAKTSANWSQLFCSGKPQFGELDLARHTIPLFQQELGHPITRLEHAKQRGCGRARERIGMGLSCFPAEVYARAVFRYCLSMLLMIKED